MKKKFSTESFERANTSNKKTAAHALRDSPYLSPVVYKPGTASKTSGQISKLPPIKNLTERKRGDDDRPMSGMSDLYVGDADRSVTPRISTPTRLRMEVVQSQDSQRAGSFTASPRLSKLSVTPQLNASPHHRPSPPPSASRFGRQSSLRSMHSPGGGSFQDASFMSTTIPPAKPSLQHLYSVMTESSVRKRAPSMSSLSSEMSTTSLPDGLLKLDVVSERTGKVLVKALVQQDVPLYHVRLLLNHAFAKKLPKGYNFIGHSGEEISQSHENTTPAVEAAHPYGQGSSVFWVAVRLPPSQPKKLPFDGPVNIEEAIKKDKNEREMIKRMSEAYQTGAFEVLSLIESKLQHYQLRLRDIFNQIENHGHDVGFSELQQAMKIMKLNLSPDQLFSLMAYLDERGEGRMKVSDLETVMKLYRRFVSSTNYPEKYLERLNSPSASNSRNSTKSGLMKELLRMDPGMKRRQNLLQPLGQETILDGIEDISIVKEELNLLDAMHTSSVKSLDVANSEGPPAPCWLKISDEEIFDILAFLGLLEEGSCCTFKQIRLKLKERARFDSRDTCGRVAFRITTIFDIIDRGWDWQKQHKACKAKDTEVHIPDPILSLQELEDLILFFDPTQRGVSFETLRSTFHLVCQIYPKHLGDWVILNERLAQQHWSYDQLMDALFPASSNGNRAQEISKRDFKEILTGVGMTDSQIKSLVQTLKSKPKTQDKVEEAPSKLQLKTVLKALKKTEELCQIEKSIDIRLELQINQASDNCDIKAIKNNMRKLYSKLKERGLRLSDVFITGGSDSLSSDELKTGFHSINNPPERAASQVQLRQENTFLAQQDGAARRKGKMELKEKMKILQEQRLDKFLHKIGASLRHSQIHLEQLFPESNITPPEVFLEQLKKRLGIQTVTSNHCHKLATYLCEVWAKPEGSSSALKPSSASINLNHLNDLIKQYRKHNWEESNHSQKSVVPTPWTVYASFTEIFQSSSSSSKKEKQLTGIEFATGLGKLREEEGRAYSDPRNIPERGASKQLEAVAKLFFQRLYDYLEGDERNFAISLGVPSSSSEVSLEDVRIWLDNLSTSKGFEGQSKMLRNENESGNYLSDDVEDDRIQPKNTNNLFAEREIFLLIDVFEVMGYQKRKAVTVETLWKTITTRVARGRHTSTVEEEATDVPSSEVGVRHSETAGANEMLVEDCADVEEEASKNETRRLLQKGKKFGEYLLLVSIDCSDEEMLIKGIDPGAGVSAEISLPLNGIADIGAIIQTGSMPDKKLGTLILNSLKFTVSDIAGGQFAIDWGKLHAGATKG